MSDNDTFNLSEDEWKSRLTDEEYHILRKKGTEPPFTGKYLQNKEEGLYICVACGETLFDSDAKYDSRSGWPSFYQPHNNLCVLEKEDLQHHMIRTEIICHKCHSHLGHVFDDGPKPTGKRYCINSMALKFKPDNN